MQQPFRLIPMIIILLFVTGCAMEGTRHISVIDKDKKDINDIVVFPLYSSSFGIGIGPDGKGPWASPTTFTKPFLLSTNEDIMSKQIQGRGIFIPPLIFIGTSKNVVHWLFIKKSYAPLVVSRQMIFSEAPIVMSLSENGDRQKCIDILLSENPDQTTLKEIFNSNHLKEKIKLELDEQAIMLLKANY
jgi:hypothetical protein